MSFSTAETARAFTEAWTSGDMGAAASYLADDVTFDGPINHASGKQEYIAGLSAFARRASGLNILAVVGDDEQAMILYELSTGPNRVTYVEWLTFGGGKIHADRLIFDSYPLRMATAAQPPAAPAE